MKIPIKNLFYLLCYAWDVLDNAGEAEVGTVESPDLENLMANVLAVRVERLLRRGLERDYQERRQDSKYIRGRIDFSETTKRLLWRRGEAHTVSDDLSVDTLANGIVKASIAALLLFDTLSRNNREVLAGLHHGLRDVTSARIGPADFYRVRLNTNNRQYQLLLSICEMIHRLVAPVESGSGMRFVSFNRAMMWKVFQKFVRNFYARRQGIYAVSADAFPWYDSFPKHGEDIALPRLETDVILSSNQRKVVIDAKYYARPLGWSHGKPILWPQHVNQLFAYMQNMAAKDKRNRTVEGILLYAGVSGSFSLEWQFFGRTLKASAIDLSQDWREIETQMLGLLPTSV